MNREGWLGAIEAEPRCLRRMLAATLGGVAVTIGGIVILFLRTFV